VINIDVQLVVGNIKHGHFEEHDSYDMILDVTEDDPDSLNVLLNVATDPICNDAQLWVVINYKRKYLLGTFEKIKLKSKGKYSNYKWVVRE
jgi:hypothetical protein